MYGTRSRPGTRVYGRYVVSRITSPETVENRQKPSETAGHGGGAAGARRGGAGGGGGGPPDAHAAPPRPHQRDAAPPQPAAPPPPGRRRRAGTRARERLGGERDEAGVGGRARAGATVLTDCESGERRSLLGGEAADEPNMLRWRHDAQDCAEQARPGGCHFLCGSGSARALGIGLLYSGKARPISRAVT